MSWKSIKREMERAGRAAEGEARSRQRELDKTDSEVEKMPVHERIEYFVEKFNNSLDLFQTIHHSCNGDVDWDEILELDPPDDPQRKTTHEDEARKAFKKYTPGIFDKALRQTEDKRNKLRLAIDEAIKLDEEEYQEALSTYELEYAEWKELKNTATRIIEGDKDAYVIAFENLEPFAGLGEYGQQVKIGFDNVKVADARLHLLNKDFIPRQEMRILQNGRVSRPDMTKTKYFSIYQDYICGSVIRVARELFALLPIKAVVVTAEIDMVNTNTGHMEMTPILSVAIPRTTLDKLRITTIDPSDAMDNFVHKMSFKKYEGFFPIEALDPEDLELIQ